MNESDGYFASAGRPRCRPTVDGGVKISIQSRVDISRGGVGGAWEEAPYLLDSLTKPGREYEWHVTRGPLLMQKHAHPPVEARKLAQVYYVGVRHVRQQNFGCVIRR